MLSVRSMGSRLRGNDGYGASITTSQLSVLAM